MLKRVLRSGKLCSLRAARNARMMADLGIGVSVSHGCFRTSSKKRGLHRAEGKPPPSTALRNQPCSVVRHLRVDDALLVCKDRLRKHINGAVHRKQGHSCRPDMTRQLTALFGPTREHLRVSKQHLHRADAQLAAVFGHEDAT
eukprot:scaffold6348_cov259-Pinguiococcus_pyrenoidosus.AAC.23